MAKQEVRFTVDLTLKPETLEEFKTIVQALIAVTQRETGALGYDWFFSADGSRCRLIETYVDADAVLAHLTGPAVKELVPKLASATTIERFEVYGDPGPEASKILAGLNAEVFELQYGLD